MQLFVRLIHRVHRNHVGAAKHFKEERAQGSRTCVPRTSVRLKHALRVANDCQKPMAAGAIRGVQLCIQSMADRSTYGSGFFAWIGIMIYFFENKPNLTYGAIFMLSRRFA
jgi:hypothetical protein